METIFKGRIKFITVFIRQGAKIEVNTTVPRKGKASTEPKLPEISFGVGDINDPGKFIPVHYEIVERGTNLNIYTRFEKDRQVFTYAPSSFKIFLPVGCVLRFIYPD